MLNKALWVKDYKQSKFVIWAFWLVSLYLPIHFFNHIKNTEYTIANWEKWGNTEPFSYYFPNDFFTPISIFHILILIVLASVLIGLERSNQSMDFTLSLPFRRRDILLTKWMLGVVHIIGALTIGVLLTYIVVRDSVIAPYLPDYLFIYYYLMSVFVLIAVYTFSMFIGLIAANVISQFVLSWIFLLFPGGFWMLIEEFIKFNFDKSINVPHIIEKLTLPIALINIRSDIHLSELQYLYVPILFTLCSLFFIVLLSNHMKSENNGKILVYEKVEPVLKIGIIVCFYLFGGMIAGNMYDWDNEMVKTSGFSPYYHVGGFIIAIIAYFVQSKLMGLRLQLGQGK